jgi:hypothetical protein
MRRPNSFGQVPHEVLIDAVVRSRLAPPRPPSLPRQSHDATRFVLVATRDAQQAIHLMAAPTNLYASGDFLTRGQ